MNALFSKTIEVKALGSARDITVIAKESPNDSPYAYLKATPQAGVRTKTSEPLFDKWGRLMAAAQRGETHAYEQLLRELDAWLRRYYARRLPNSAAEDARQEALLAVHAGRHGFAPSRSFGPWVLAIARYKWIDGIREASRHASRFAALPVCEIPVKDHEDAVISAMEVKKLLGRITPAQAAVIRLVKLEGASIDGASRATGQSTALVKVNIHRGLRRLASLVRCGPGTPESWKRPALRHPPLAYRRLILRVGSHATESRASRRD